MSRTVSKFPSIVCSASWDKFARQPDNCRTSLYLGGDRSTESSTNVVVASFNSKFLDTAKIRIASSVMLGSVIISVSFSLIITVWLCIRGIFETLETCEPRLRTSSKLSGPRIARDSEDFESFQDSRPVSRARVRSSRVNSSCTNNTLVNLKNFQTIPEESIESYYGTIVYVHGTRFRCTLRKESNAADWQRFAEPDHARSDSNVLV